MEGAAGIAPADPDGRLVWKVPGKAVCVRLSQDVAGRLGASVREGFKALPRRGLETGGLLFGTRRERGGQATIDVDDFEPVECEHAAGPSYLLSEADRRRLAARITARKAAARKNSIVGFYRSHTRRDFAITAEDNSLFATYFQKASDVFLLVESNEGGPPTGGFIIREGGKVLSSRPYAQFPLDGTRVAAAAGETPVPASQISSTPPRAVQPPEPPRPAGMMRRPVWLAVAGTIALAVSLPFEIQRHISGSIPAEPAVPLALHVTSTGDSLRLSWDHHALRHAGGAVLWIKDGQVEQKLELDSKQLNEGAVEYWPRTGDVNFRLELLPPGGASESVRAIGGPSTGLVAGLNAPMAGAAEGSAAALPFPKSRHHDGIGMASRQLSRVFTLPQPEPLPAAAPALPDAPAIGAAFAPPREPDTFLRPAVATHGSPPSHAADSYLQVSVEPVPGSRLGRLAREIPLIGNRNRRPDYRPPVALSHPALPNSPHGRPARDVDIDVKVYVNTSGQVDYSEVLSNVAKPDRDLAVLAVFSARRWQFVPAREGNVSVPGQVILHYRFGAGASAAGNPGVATR